MSKVVSIYNSKMRHLTIKSSIQKLKYNPKIVINKTKKAKIDNNHLIHCNLRKEENFHKNHPVD